MQLWCTLEFLVYLGIFLLYLKVTECAAMELMKPTVDILTTTERSLRNESASKSSVFVSRLKLSFAECQNSLSWMCLKLELIRLLENLTERDELNLAKGISLVKDFKANEIKTADLMAEAARNYPHDPTARLNGFIINKVYNLMQTHYLRFKLIADDQIIEEARSLLQTGRADKFGKKGGMEALMAAGLMMKGTLMAMGISFIALIAGKALITSLMALTMASVVGLKSLTSGGGKSHTYEIVAKPVYSASHSHSISHDDGDHGAHMGHSGSAYGGYARTLNLNLSTHGGRGKIQGRPEQI